MAKVTAWALQEKGRKAMFLSGIKCCDRSAGQGYDEHKIPTADTAASPFRPPGRACTPSAALALLYPSSRRGSALAEQRRTGTRRIRPALGATTASVPAAKHRETKTKERHEGPGGGRRKAEPPPGRHR